MFTLRVQANIVNKKKKAKLLSIQKLTKIWPQQ